MNERVRKWLRPLRPATRLARYTWHRLKPRESYADDREDVAATLLLGRIRHFIDVGANDGVSCSNTALAALHGARGLCFEPNPNEFRRLQEFYRLAPGIDCVQEGLSDVEGKVALRCDGLLSAITHSEDAGLSTLLTKFKRDDAEVLEIKVGRLSRWLDARPEFRSSDLVSIDVEGHELNVLSGIDWTRTPKPARCFVIETHGKNATQQWRHRDFDAIADLLARQNYRKLAASRNNTFWLHADDGQDARILAARAQCPHYTWF